MSPRTIPTLVAAAVAVGAALGGGAFAAGQAADPFALSARMHAAMASDSAEGVAAAAAELAAQAKAAAPRAEDPAAYAALAAAAETMTGNDLAVLREQFKAVSKALAAVVDAGGVEGAQLYYCSMADGYWLQAAADAGAKNPYYGKSMLRCGEKVDKVDKAEG